MGKDFREKVALVTGAAHRVGAKIALKLSQSGYRVAIHCNSSLSEAQLLAAEIGNGEAKVFQGDLTDDAFCGSLIPHVAETFGRLDLLVNNAACYHRCSLEEAAPEMLLRDFKLNCFAPIELMRQFSLRHQPGCIVNVLDGRIAKCDTGAAGYNLSKQALAEATRSAALEWAQYGIRVNGVAPGLVCPAEGVPMERMMRLLDKIPMKCRTSEAQIADCIAFLAGAETVTGEILYVDGGLHLADTALGEKKKNKNE